MILQGQKIMFLVSCKKAQEYMYYHTESYKIHRETGPFAQHVGREGEAVFTLSHLHVTFRNRTRSMFSDVKNAVKPSSLLYLTRKWEVLLVKPCEHMLSDLLSASVCWSVCALAHSIHQPCGCAWCVLIRVFKSFTWKRKKQKQKQTAAM